MVGEEGCCQNRGASSASAVGEGATTGAMEPEEVLVEGLEVVLPWENKEQGSRA